MTASDGGIPGKMAGIAGVFCPLQPAHSDTAVHREEVVAQLQ